MASVLFSFISVLIMLAFVAAFFLVLISRFIRQINQYERGVLFTFGRFSRIVNPGWFIMWPIIHQLKKVDIRTKTVDVPNQEVITKDNIPVQVNAVVYFRVKDARMAVIEVEDYVYATAQLAQTTMRNSIGEYTLDQLLQDRADVAHLIQHIVDEATDPWGIEVQSVELKDIILSDSLKQTIAKVAQAERERKAVIITSQGEVEAAKNMAIAAQTLATSPGAMQLRTLSTLADLGNSQSNNTVWIMPTDLVNNLSQITAHLNTPATPSYGR